MRPAYKSSQYLACLPQLPRALGRRQYTAERRAIYSTLWLMYAGTNSGAWCCLPQCITSNKVEVASGRLLGPPSVNPTFKYVPRVNQQGSDPGEITSVWNQVAEREQALQLLILLLYVRFCVGGCSPMEASQNISSYI